jgi:hypothetical protein
VYKQQQKHSLIVSKDKPPSGGFLADTRFSVLSGLCSGIFFTKQTSVTGVSS